jgi:hypothetical protein
MADSPWVWYIGKPMVTEPSPLLLKQNLLSSARRSIGLACQRTGSN